MTVRGWSLRLMVIGATIGFGTTAWNHDAAARSRSAHARTEGHARGEAHYGRAHARYASFISHRSWGGRLQCVPFARENTGIELSGNANTWWDGAEGVYERGAKPEVGSVLNFRSTGRMRMGHVAVVTNVVDARRIRIDQANWGGPGLITRDVEVVDVSPTNDWTAVRVALDSTQYGSIYPTYGFIYDRPDHGTMVANNQHAPAPALNPPPADLRPTAERAEPEEVAEAEDDVPTRFSRHRATRHGRHVGSYAARGHGSRAALYRVSSHEAQAAPRSHRRRF